MSTKRFLGYDTDENGRLVINQEQSKIVERIYEEYLSGKTAEHIKRIFESEGIMNWDGRAKWEASTIKSILKNEKYKGDAILQKTYTVDFLSKKRAKNKGELQQYHIEDNHEPIIDPLVWEAAQMETIRRREYMKEFGLKAYATKPETNPFAGKIICGHCNKPYTRKTWKSGDEVRKIWQCQDRYRINGEEGCTNRNVDEKILENMYFKVLKIIINNRNDYMSKWKVMVEFGNPLEQYRAIHFSDQTEFMDINKELNLNTILSFLDQIIILESGGFNIKLMDGRIYGI